MKSMKFFNGEKGHFTEKTFLDIETKSPKSSNIFISRHVFLMTNQLTEVQ